jgi:hypothetical protein
MLIVMLEPDRTTASALCRSHIPRRKKPPDQNGVPIRRSATATTEPIVVAIGLKTDRSRLMRRECGTLSEASARVNASLAIIHKKDQARNCLTNIRLRSSDRH